MPLLDSVPARNTFEQELERIRRGYGCYIVGYVVMPEHVHLLISEPERSQLSVVIQMLKQITSHKLKARAKLISGKFVITISQYGVKESGSRNCVTSIATL